MEETQRDHLTWGLLEEEREEEKQKKFDMSKYYFGGDVEMAVVKCAIDLGMADAIANHGRPMTLLELSSALDCDLQNLHRVMRFLVNHGIFKEIIIRNEDTVPTAYYAQTHSSRRLMRTGENSMAAFILMQSSPPAKAAWHCLSACVKGKATSAFEVVHGEDVWKHAEANPAQSQLINEAMACLARVIVSAIIDGCLDMFEGVETLVDVGGGTGTIMRRLVKACPWISKGITFDLPHVVSLAEQCEGIEYVGGDMFEFIPKADAVLLVAVLHDWGDDECIRILKKCRKAIPKDKGKVIIVEVVIGNKEQQKEDNKLNDVGLVLDMAMMALTHKGKERTLDEWAYVLREAGFSRHTVRSIAAIQSVIEAFPA
ncbi:3'-hydroxy-N-methyl-(S)-coclaurine 4'-O-methyltransferase [Morus notabilis]|uniref:3'-hydroxy-N-methyl-(S)-coclaurine 4'-O-methyltransferase n=1 Tax=Morus notabilis TaxID=981085 RepID=W9RSU8_9ROSA|nr:acetylserotonin O-methyltransferase [Morus notabilis]EXB94571.1 3'-hydroxy-N-methyl-(S)-coclaurine 4'-O-methyltransferase [Morus notabilis]